MSCGPPVLSVTKTADAENVVAGAEPDRLHDHGDKLRWRGCHGRHPDRRAADRCRPELVDRRRHRAGPLLDPLAALTCDFGDMAAGTSFTVHISSETTEATVADSPVENTATVDADNTIRLRPPRRSGSSRERSCVVCRYGERRWDRCDRHAGRHQRLRGQERHDHRNDLRRPRLPTPDPDPRQWKRRTGDVHRGVDVGPGGHPTRRTRLPARPSFQPVRRGRTATPRTPRTGRRRSGATGRSIRFPRPWGPRMPAGHSWCRITQDTTIAESRGLKRVHELSLLINLDPIKGRN